MSDTRETLDRLGVAFPKHAIKQREGGSGRRFDYVETHTVIRRLNEVAGTWDFQIKSLDLRGDLYVCVGALTIPGLGTREGIGVQKVSERGGEDLVKGASSDALKKAATLFGVALDLYGPDYEAGEVAAPVQPQRRDERRTNAPQARQDAPRAATPAEPEQDTKVSPQQHQKLIDRANEYNIPWGAVVAEGKRRWKKESHQLLTSEARVLYGWIREEGERRKAKAADTDAPTQQTLTNDEAPIEEPSEEWMR